MRYLVIYERTNTGYSAYSPDVSGCIATGGTREETERMIKEALEFHLEGLREEGLSVPVPGSHWDYLDIAAGLSRAGNPSGEKNFDF